MARAIEEDDGLARVRAGGATTRYRRTGRGRPVLLLCDPADERFEALVERLARGRCVIAPQEPQDGLRVERLAGFLDGLGIASAAVIGVGRGAGPAAAFARLRPDRVEGLVLLEGPGGDPAARAEAVLSALERESD